MRLFLDRGQSNNKYRKGLINLNIIETLRNDSISALPNGFASCFPVWKERICELAPVQTPRQIMDLGDNLSSIFNLTRTEGRSQSDVSGGGTAWEALVCWYLNLCLIGRRTVVIKHNKKLIPLPVRDAITVNYGNFASNTESDLVAITFPDRVEYSTVRENIFITDEHNLPVPTLIGQRFNRNGLMNALCHRDFAQLEIHIIQCKTNWNDNAQIPMLWDMVYSANEFRANITIGQNGYSIHGADRFTYSFVTVPTSRMDNVSSSSTHVRRVAQISGGNYWGKPTVNGVSSSVKEMLNRNLLAGHRSSHMITLGAELPRLNTDYSYFGI